MASVRPFDKLLKRQPGDKGSLVSVSGFFKRLLGLRNFTFSAQGIDITQPKPDVLHFHVNNGANGSGLNFAWQMNVTSDGAGNPAVSVTPGVVLIQAPMTSPDLTQQNFCVPQIASTPLTQSPPPVLPVNAVGDTFIMLEVLIDRNGNPQSLPWQIKSYSTAPTDVQVVRPFGAGNGQDGVLHAPMAQFSGGVQVGQFWLARPITVLWFYNTVIFV